MKTLGCKRKLPTIVFLLCLPSFWIYVPSLYALERPVPSKSIKGFIEVGLSTQTGTRTVVEETGPGVNFKGDAESTRVLVRIATKPVRPLEVYLQGGMANLIIDEFNDYRGDYEFAYGGGLALTVYEYPGPERFKILTRIDTLHFETTDNILTKISNIDTFVKETIRWREYTLEGIGLWRSQYWEPYIGARFSWLDSKDIIHDPRVGSLSLEEDGNFGFVLGANLYLDPRENFAVNLEATLIDQNAIKVGFKLWY